MNQYFIYHSPIGKISFVFKGGFLVEVKVDTEFACLPKCAATEAETMNRIQHEMTSYFDGRLREFTQEIKFIKGTCFEQKVWLALKDIPYGETRSYRWLAESIGRPKAVRAVGRALKKNPLPVILPCHRVIRGDGTFGGYAMGTATKKRLLHHEKSI